MDQVKSPEEIRVAALLLTQLGNEILVKEDSADVKLATIFKLLDQYLVNSNLATFPYRLQIIEAITLWIQQEIGINQTQEKPELIGNMLGYIIRYYTVYREVYEERMKDIQKPIQEKLSELIRIAKWDISNYFAFQRYLISHNKFI